MNIAPVTHPKLALLAISTAAFASASSCAMLNLPAGGIAGAVAPVAPKVTFQSATLARAPSQQQLAAYYCPDVVQVPFGGAGLLCSGFFGGRPSVADMTVSFDLLFRIENPNNIPIPLASVLTAATVFPAATNQKLGAICVQICGEGQSGCTGGLAPPGACEASTRDVRSLNDFAGAAANVLIAAGLSAAAGQPFTFTLPPVNASSQIDVVVRFSFGPEQLLQTMRQLASQSVSELKAGRRISFSIPFRIEGTAFFDAGSFGRIAVGYGPVDGTWMLPAAGLLPAAVAGGAAVAPPPPAPAPAPAYVAPAPAPAPAPAAAPARAARPVPPPPPPPPPPPR